MEKHGTPLWFERTLITLAIVLFLLCCLLAETPVYAAPAHQRIIVDDAVGSDSNSGLTDTDPVTSSNGSWHRVQSLGVFGADTGVFPRNVSDTPEAHWVRDVMRNKPDRIERRETREVIAGHGQLPHEDVEESEIAGARVRRRYVWVIMQAANGELFETCVGAPETVEIY